MEDINDKEINAIRNLVGAQIRRVSSDNSGVTERHLDDDKLTAFVEGRLSEKESKPMISHLVGCNLCRGNVAQLVRLNAELGEVEVTKPITASEQGRVRRFLESFTVRLFGNDEESVFAYHAPAETQDEESLKEKEASSEKESKEEKPID